MTIIIGIIGTKQSGKDTIGNYLKERYGFSKYAFADPIKEISKILFDLSEKQVNGSNQEKDEIDPRWNLNGRQVLQRLGTEFGQFKIFDIFPELKEKIKYRELWVYLFDAWLKNHSNKNIVITDVRFIHEMEHIKKLGGNILKISRNTGLDDNHISECESQQIQETNIDFNIDNNNTLHDLYSQVDTFVSILNL